MTFQHIQAVILDWAGTAVDFGSRAPVAALRRVFESAGIPLSPAEARQDMGRLKMDHIRAILEQPRVNAAWQSLHGAPPRERDVELLFTEFLPAQADVLEAYGDVIPGVATTVENWRAAGLRIGSTTGYTRDLMEIVRARAAQQGYAPDVNVTPDMVGGGRPLPFMMYRNAIELRAWPLWACVKIGDTPVDVQEGLNAGAWSIGITSTGNEVGLSEEELSALPAGERRRRIDGAGKALAGAGAHFTAASVAECDELLDEIDRRLAAGCGPWEPRA
ncbi:MAG: phosphonoacetaldehyde hydrolase [Bryobacteraceae bacterium]|jgi:phosphonoacetaldehyde hydrolase